MKKVRLGRVLMQAFFGMALISGTASADMAAPKEQFMSLGTSSAGGSFFPLAGAMVSVVGKYYPQLKINAEITGGSTDNVKLINNGQLELALTSAQTAYEAARGQGKFVAAGAQTKHLGVMAGHGTVWQLYTLKKTGIKSIYDLKGKRVSLGGTGSDGNALGKEVIEAHGLIMNKDWKAEYISHGDGPGALRDGQIDAVLQVSSTPTATVIDITATNGEDVEFINPDPKVLEQLIKKHPYWSKAIIPGGVYKGHPNDISGSFMIAAVMVAAKSDSPEAVYAFTKALLEHPDELKNANALGKFWNKDNAVQPLVGIVPFHPGAEKYYREVGLLK